METADRLLLAISGILIFFFVDFQFKFLAGLTPTTLSWVKISWGVLILATGLYGWTRQSFLHCNYKWWKYLFILSFGMGVVGFLVYVQKIPWNEEDFKPFWIFQKDEQFMGSFWMLVSCICCAVVFYNANRSYRGKI